MIGGLMGGISGGQGGLDFGGGGPSSAGSTTNNNNGFNGGSIQFGSNQTIPTWLIVGVVIVGAIYVVKRKK
ncbi:hypothetical protein M2H12_14945 [Vibrio vulnificus]|nr:hypothetical protein [Vibrio vulnificus]MCU8166997.1 hypothetical protein [Vibrio vulnificus]MCU8171436.1 hypothetical protein [Vibrio vulnificus]